MANSQTGARLVYRNAVKSMIRAGVDPKSAVLSQSYLRFEQQVSSTKTNYQFGVLVNDSGNSGAVVRPTEQRLNLQDSFYVSSVQVLIANTTTTATSFPLYSYPSQTAWSVATDWYNLYNGYLSLTVNNRTIVTAWDIQRHFEANQTQGTASPAATGKTLIDQFSGLDNGACETEPNWVLIGSKNNSLNINLPAAISTITGNAAANYICLILRGVLAQNVTVVS